MAPPSASVSAEVRRLEKNKAGVIGHEDGLIAVCSNRADAEELFMDLVMEAQFGAFCWNWLYFQDSLELCLRYSRNDGGYWFTDVTGWR